MIPQLQGSVAVNIFFNVGKVEVLLETFSCSNVFIVSALIIISRVQKTLLEKAEESQLWICDINWANHKVRPGKEHRKKKGPDAYLNVII